MLLAAQQFQPCLDGSSLVWFEADLKETCMFYLEGKCQRGLAKRLSLHVQERDWPSLNPFQDEGERVSSVP